MRFRKIIDQSGRGFFTVDNAIIDNYRLTPHELTIYCLLIRHIGLDLGDRAVEDLIVNKCGMSQKNTREALRRLEKKGVVSIEHKEDGVKYVLLEVSEYPRSSG